MKEKIKIEIEIGHWAKRLSGAPVQPVLPNSAVQNATHVWKVWVCGRNGQLDSFVQRVVFRLHPTFPTPTIVVNQPPFEIEEKAFGTFPMKIELHFNDSMASFDYEVFLMLDRDINCKSIKSFAIANPRPPEFREKLILAGGVVVDPSEEAAIPADTKAAKTVKAPGVPSGLVRHKSKSKTSVGGTTGLQLDDLLMFGSPASSDELAAPSAQQLSPPQPPLHPATAVVTGVKSVGSRLASPSKAKLKESSGGWGPLPPMRTDQQKSPAKPKPQPAMAIVKAEPTSNVGSPAPTVAYAEPSPRVSELRAEDLKSEKLVLKISKSPVKSSPVTTVMADALVPTDAAVAEQRPPQAAMVAVVAPTHSTPPVGVVLNDIFEVVLPPPQPPQALSHPPPLPPQPAISTAEPQPMPPYPRVVAEGFASASEEDRRKRKKEKRKKDKDKHRHRHRSRHADGSAGDSDSDERRHDRKRRRHEGKEKKKRRRTETEAAAAALASSTASMDSGLDEDAAVAATAAVALAPQPPRPPPTLEAEPPMLSPYLQSAGPKEDPELMSQASVESTGFRPPIADDGSSESSPFGGIRHTMDAAIPVSAAAMAAETAAAASASAYAKHPKYQWTDDLGLSRAEYDQRFQLCLLAASLEDPGRLERLAAVLAASGALTARDAEYAHFDLARLGPECVRQLRALLMPDS